MATYECARLEQTSNIYGGYDCDEWVEVQQQEVVPLLPPLTIAQVNDISIQCCLLLVLASSFRFFSKLI